MSGEERTEWRRNTQMVFQDPESSLNDRMTTGEIIREPLDVHDWKSKRERRERVFDLLDTVGMHSEHYYRYPHQFSGGQRQRIGIARALALEPDFVVLDEPVSALDVSVQAQIINLLEDLQDDFGLTFLFIAHDLSVVRHIADRVAVMYLGNVMEIGPAERIFEDPANPYTISLLSAIPEPDPTAEKDRVTLQGTPPTPRDPPMGCPFETRCPMKIRPDDREEIDDELWERIETFREVVRERDRADRSLSERARDVLGLETDVTDVRSVREEVFEDVTVPERVASDVDEAVQHVRDGDLSTARAHLHERFGSVCDFDPPADYEVGRSGRTSRCHRHEPDEEPPRELVDEVFDR
jgi:peptide/nickel transport system ATP-binding protein